MSAVVFEKKDSVLKVALNRASVLNAINSTVLTALESGLRSYSADADIKMLMLYGNGGCFASGADIKELAGLDAESMRAFHDMRENAFALLENFPAPTMAVIEKYALGSGLELALCCDFRLAEQDAKLGVPSAKLGIVESYAYLVRLVRTIGPSHAKKLIFSGIPIKATTAYEIGLVEEIVAPSELYSRATSLMETICSRSRHALVETKKVIRDCARDPNLSSIKDASMPMIESFQTADCKEALTAFINKRKQ